MPDAVERRRDDGGQYLEDMATAYWSSETLFAALELDIFSALAHYEPLAALATAACCRPAELERLLIALRALKLVERTAAGWRNEAVASRYLVRDSADYLGDFLLYRRYLQASWQQLAARISNRPLPDRLSPADDYQTRNLHYVRALDALARRKAEEIISMIPAVGEWQSPILDIGGGAAALSRCLLRKIPAGRAVLLELEEVLAAATAIYPAAEQWAGIERRCGDFRKIKQDERFGVILLANMLHIYAPDDARKLLTQAAGLLLPGGRILIHDYFPDRQGEVPAKGALYDLNMMLNTYEGRCHNSAQISAWLLESGLCDVEITDLGSDSGIITARSKN